MWLFNALFWFLRLRPLGLLAFAALFAGMGYFFAMQGERFEANKRAALDAGQPPAVAIEAFLPERDVHTLGEVNVDAQLDLTRDYQLTITTNLIFKNRMHMIPLFAADAFGAQAQPYGMLVIHDADTDVQAFSPLDHFGARAGRFGAFGPVLAVSGRRGSLGKFDDMVREAFAEQGLRYPSSPVIISPYLEGRERAFAPREVAEGVYPMAWLAMLTLLFAFAKVVAGRHFARRAREAELFPATAGAEEAAMANDVAEPQEPLWKQRALARKADESVARYDPEARPEEPEEAPQLDLRKAASAEMIHAAGPSGLYVAPIKEKNPERWFMIYTGVGGLALLLLFMMTSGHVPIPGGPVNMVAANPPMAARADTATAVAAPTADAPAAERAQASRDIERTPGTSFLSDFAARRPAAD